VRPNPEPAGYSGTPLAKKLGISAHAKVLCMGAPPEYKTLLGSIPEGVVFQTRLMADTDIVHVFDTHRASLARTLTSLRQKIRKDSAVWVSWPKKASKVATDITEDVIRELALPQGFVDIKVCAVNDVWSGLKLVIRKEFR
jgi:hypothetical protein